MNCYDKIIRSVEQGAAITAHLLTFGAHKTTGTCVCDAGQLIKNQVGLLRPLLDSHIYLSAQAENGLFVAASPDDLSQILLNLCLNARDAMPDGGQILIEAARDSTGNVRIDVIDTGVGIAPENIPKIFDPFFTTKSNGHGTGLGLTMVYGMVKDMNGTVDVSSRHGAGTNISIYLPAAEMPVADCYDATDNLPYELNEKTILLVEDENDLIAILSHNLSECGIRVLHARNGNEALAVQEGFDGHIDFLLTDVVMPELNGVRLAELFSAVRPQTRILFMSGYPAKGQMARVTIPDGSVLLPKPVQAETVVQVMRMVLAPDGCGPPRDTSPKERWKTV